MPSDADKKRRGFSLFSFFNTCFKEPKKVYLVFVVFGDSINILGLFQFERTVEAKPRYKSSLYLISLRKVKTRFSPPAKKFLSFDSLSKGSSKDL